MNNERLSNARMSDSKIKLSEELVKIVNKLPWNFPTSPNLPDLLVEPSGFRRIVENGMETCKDFLNTIQNIEENIEKNIPGITSFYLLTSEGKKRSDILCTISGSIVNRYASTSETSYYNETAAERQRKYGFMEDTASPIRSDLTESDMKSELKKAIFEKVGNIMLYMGRKLDQEEIISFYTALMALEKTMALKVDTNYCISTLGSVQFALEVGKLYGRSVETIYFGERSLQTETKPRDLLPIQHLWPIFAKLSIMKTILENLKTKDK